MRHWGGFTLIELLVVTGIIAILTSMLLPILSKAREMAQSAMCQSNMRQIGQAFQLYVNDNQGTLPPASADWTRYTYPYSEFCWYYYLASKYLPGSVAPTSYDWETTPYSMPKVRLDNIYTCPADMAAMSQKFVASTGIGMSYAVNFNVVREYMSPANPPVKVCRINDTASVMLLLERRSDVYCTNGNGFAPNIDRAYRAYQWLSVQPQFDATHDAAQNPMPPANSGPHRGGKTVNVLYVDGHVAGEDFNDLCFSQRGMNGYSQQLSNHRWGIDQILQ